MTDAHQNTDTADFAKVEPTRESSNAESPLQHTETGGDLKNTATLQNSGTNGELNNTETKATYLPPDAISHLTQEHQDYLMKRHGTLDLDPIPGPGDADPYNWPQWKVSQAKPNLPKVKSTDIPRAESRESHLSGDPRPDVDFHRRSHHPRLPNHGPGSWSPVAVNHLPDFSPNRHSRSRTIALEAILQHLWPSPAVPHLLDLQSGGEYRVC